MFTVTREPLSVQQINDLVKRPTDGAVVTFDGIVRNNFDGRAVRYLDYEAYTEMAEKKDGGNRCRSPPQIPYRRDRHRPPSWTTGDW